MKVVHGLIAVVGVACAASIGLLVYAASGQRLDDQHSLGAGDADATSSAAPRASKPASAPLHTPAIPVAETFLVGPWEVAVLSTNHDAADEIGQGNHPDTFHAVLTTLQITNTADTVQDVYLLDFQFGALEGTQNGYGPWDDWCAPFPENVYGNSMLYLPGETRTVGVCVPVDPRDAARLTMWVSYFDGNESGGEVELLLPPDGEEWAPRPHEDVASVQARALAKAGRSADGWGYHLTVTDVAVGEVVDGKRVVSLSLQADPMDTSAPPAGYALARSIGPSGNSYVTSQCGSPREQWVAFDGTAWTQDLCMTVDALDAESMLIVFPGSFIGEASVHLDARPN